MCLIWGSTWMVIKIGLAGAPPVTAVGLRFLIAALVVGMIVLWRRVSPPRTSHFLRLGVFLGVFQVALPYVLVYWSEQHISSGLTAVLYSTMPLMVASLARVFLGDPVTPRKVLGIVSGIAGVGVIFSDSLQWSGSRGAWGVGAVLVSVFFASLASVFLKKHGRDYHPIVALLWPFTVAAVALLGAAVPLERSNPAHYGLATWSTIVYLAVAGSVIAFSLFYWILRYVDVTVVSYQTFLIPILAVFLGWIFLDEVVTQRVGIGAACILIGIGLATLRPRRRSSSSITRPVA